jgi:hypothetical protein
VLHDEEGFQAIIEDIEVVEHELNVGGVLSICHVDVMGRGV